MLDNAAMHSGNLALVAIALGSCAAPAQVVVWSHRLPEPPLATNRVAVDKVGNAYVVQETWGGGAYVSKVNAEGRVWTMRAGNGTRSANGVYPENAASVAVDGEGNVWLVGGSQESPTAGNAFIAKLSPAGEILFTSYFGGRNDDRALDVTADRAGNIYVTGITSSPDFPTRNAPQSSLAGASDAFVVKLDAAGNTIYSTYLGRGGDQVLGRRIRVDAAGNAYVAGNAAGAAACGFGPRPFPCPHAFVARIDPSGKLVWSVDLAGSRSEVASALALDRDGNVYVGGYTESSDFPTRDALQPVFIGGVCTANSACSDAFIARLDPEGRLMYSSFLGGSRGETLTDIAVDAYDRVYAVGGTWSPDFPQVRPFEPRYSNSCMQSPPPYYTIEVCADAFVVQLTADGSALLFSSFLDCVSCSYGLGLSLDDAGRLFIAGGGGIEVFTPQFTAMLDFSGKPEIRPSSIVNAASFVPGPISPGEIVIINGTGLGPVIPANLPWDAVADRSWLGGTRVWFNGIVAPLMSADAAGIRVVAPYGVADRGSAELVVEWLGTRSDSVSVPVVQAAPGIYTWNLLFGGAPGQGLDRAFVYNTDGKQNSPRDAAPRGSTVTFFATGTGQTDPPVMDGQTAIEVLPKPVLPVSVRIGGTAAEVLYARGAQGFINGLTEIHARIADETPAGDALPLELTVGQATSQPGVAISVR